MDHSLHLGVELPALPAAAGVDDLARWRAVATSAEEAGFGAVWVSGDRCDPCVLAGGLVPATTSVVLGVVVELAGGRHPSVLARDLTGLDVLCGGRSAVLLDVSAEEAERLDDAVRICRALFDGDVVHVSGRYYSVDGAVNRPGPARPGGPPMLATGYPRQPGRSGRGGTVDGWVVTGAVDDLTATRAGDDPPVWWRGDVADAATVDALVRAGVAGVIARAASPGQVQVLADLLVGRWPG